MSIASEISKSQNNLKDCYDVCKSVDGVVLPEDKNFDNLPALIEQALNPFNKPADWTDIRRDCPANSIALYAGHKADYSQYDNLGFTATCVGGYKVFIDGTQYGSTYASGTQCTITWSTSGITTGDNITTPSALKAHKIWIEPATEGNNITAFRCNRVAASGTEEQGILWAHFNISNQINLSELFRGSNQIRQSLVKAITAKNNKIFVSAINFAFTYCSSLEYLPLLLGDGVSDYSFQETFRGCSKITNISLKDININYIYYAFATCSALERIKYNNVSSTNVAANASNAYSGCQSLKNILPYIANASTTTMSAFLTQGANLEDTTLDTRGSTSLGRIGCFGDSTYFMGGFKGLRVSNEAPFNNATAPQINVSYTGMDRNALVQLFNDLPTVSAGQIINILGATGASDLTAEDEAIATGKGWTITK